MQMVALEIAFLSAILTTKDGSGRPVQAIAGNPEWRLDCSSCAPATGGDVLSEGGTMKNSDEILREKEKALHTLRRELEALRIVAPLLTDASEAVPKKPAKSENWRNLQTAADKFTACHQSARICP